MNLSERAAKIRPSALQISLETVLPLLVVVAFPVLMQWVLAPAAGPYASNVLLVMGINVVLAVSLNMVNGFTGQFSMGHAGFMAVGGYVAGTITYYGGWALFGETGRHGGAFGAGEWLFVVAISMGALGAAFSGYIVGLPSLRLKGDYLALVTLGFGEIVRVMITLSDPKVSASTLDAGTFRLVDAKGLHVPIGGAIGMSPLPAYSNQFWVWLFAAITLLVAIRLKHSTHGRAFLAVREDEIAAEAMGIPTTTVKVRAFVLSAAFAGVAGALYASQLGSSLSPKELGFQKSFEVIIMVVLGGMGSVSGSALAAVFLTVLPEKLRDVSEYRMVIYALTLIGMMLVRPQGLLGLHELWNLPRADAARMLFRGGIVLLVLAGLALGVHLTGLDVWASAAHADLKATRPIYAASTVVLLLSEPNRVIGLFGIAGAAMLAGSRAFGPKKSFDPSGKSKGTE